MCKIKTLCIFVLNVRNKKLLYFEKFYHTLYIKFLLLVLNVPTYHATKRKQTYSYGYTLYAGYLYDSVNVNRQKDHQT